MKFVKTKKQQKINIIYNLTKNNKEIFANYVIHLGKFNFLYELIIIIISLLFQTKVHMDIKNIQNIL